MNHIIQIGKNETKTKTKKQTIKNAIFNASPSNHFFSVEKTNKNWLKPCTWKQKTKNKKTKKNKYKSTLLGWIGNIKKKKEKNRNYKNQNKTKQTIINSTSNFFVNTSLSSIKFVKL